MDKAKALSELRERVCDANIELFNSGLIISTFGNVSEKLEHESVTYIAIKPSGVSYKNLKPVDIPILNICGKHVYGDLRPSSDTPTHLHLYQQLPNVGGITHTHSTHATAWAQSGKAIPILGTTHADYGYKSIPCTNELPIAAIESNYEINTGVEIVDCLKNNEYLDANMVLVKSHGPFTMGKSGGDAVHHAIILEEIAKIAFITFQLNPQSIEISESLIDKHYSRKHGPKKYYGQDK
jgi:L-ribulose-5-phosphate 4-epimerase